ncbi:hypothetical protein GCM10010191_03850 [Actinomadura vinacea]|uniref:Uncharacterized protein n=1 Tax=Actinomadura vinacea TaxID=115336 RepID=A0ABN3IBN2_9ACTN
MAIAGHAPRTRGWWRIGNATPAGAVAKYPFKAATAALDRTGEAGRSTSCATPPMSALANRPLPRSLPDDAHAWTPPDPLTDPYR